MQNVMFVYNTMSSRYEVSSVGISSAINIQSYGRGWHQYQDLRILPVASLHLIPVSCNKVF